MANEGYAGEVRISTKLDNSGIRKDVAKTEKEIDRLTAAFDREAQSIKKQENALKQMRKDLEAITSGDKQLKSIRDLEQSLKRIKAETREVEKENADLIAQYNAAVAEVDNLRAAGFKDAQIAPQIAEVDRLAESMRPVWEELDRIDAKAKDVESSISAIEMNPENSVEAEKLHDDISLAEDKLDSSRQKAVGLKEALREAFAARSSALIRDLTGIEDSSDRASKRVRKLGREAKTAGGQARKASTGFEKLTSRIGRLFKTVFFYNIIRKTLDFLKTELGALLQANEAFAQSWNNVQVNLLAAFAPLWEIAQPRLISFVRVLERLTLMLAKFIALMFGKTYEQAKDSAEAIRDEAEAMKEAGKEADKTGKKLAQFDEINQLATDKDKKTGLDFGAWQDTSWMGDLEKKFAKILDIIQQVADVFKKAWDREGLDFLDAFWRMLNSVKRLIYEIGKTWLEVWTGGHGEEFVAAIFRLLKMIFLIIGDIAIAFTEAWTGGDVGRRLVESLFEMFTAILNLLYSIGAAFREAWNDGTGVDIATNLFQVWTNINLTVAQFAMRLQEAWEENDNGVRIWGAILGLVNDILSTINRMTFATMQWASNLNLGPLVGGVANLAEAFRRLASIVVDALGWAYINILLPLIGWLTELFVPAALNLLAAAFDAISAVLEALKPWAMWVWEDWLQPLGKWAGEQIIKLVNLLTDAFIGFSDWARENPDKIQLMAEIILSMLAGIWIYNTGKKIIDFISNLVLAFRGFANGLNLASLQAGILTAGIGALMYAIIQIAKHWGDMNGLEKMISVLGAVAIAASVAAVALGAVKSIAGAALAAAAIIGGIAMVTASVNSARARAGISSSGGFSGRSMNLQSIAPMSLPTYDVKSIPHLASGTVAMPNAPYAAIVGDNKREPEIISPVSTMEQALENVLDRRGGVGGGRSQTVILEIDGRELARATYEHNEGERQRRGVRMSTT